MKITPEDGKDLLVRHLKKNGGVVDDHFMDALRYIMSMKEMRERSKNGVERAKEILYGRQGQRVKK